MALRLCAQQDMHAHVQLCTERTERLPQSTAPPMREHAPCCACTAPVAPLCRGLRPQNVHCMLPTIAVRSGSTSPPFRSLTV